MRRSLFVVLALAALVRLLLLVDAQDAPFWSVPMVDEVAYLQLAERLVQGEAPPLGAYYVAPGYAWFLAGFLKAGVADVTVIKLLQTVVGVLNAGLLFLLGRRFFGDATGILAGVLWSLVPSVLLHEILLLKPTLTVALVLTALWAVARAEPARPGQWGLAGLSFGSAALLRGEMLVVGLGLLGVALWRQRRSWRGPLLGLLGLLAVVAVPTAQNLARGGGFVLVAYGGGPNLYIGNHPGADGSYRPLRPDRSDASWEERDAVEIARNASGRSLDPSGVSAFWRDKAFQYWKLAPGEALALTLKKAALVWGWWEGSDVLSTGLAGRWIGLLRNPVVVPGVLFPLAWIGMFLARRRPGVGWLLGFLGLAWVALVPFFLFERFRLPLLAVATLFAAFALVRGVATLRARRPAPVLLGALVAVVVSGLLSLPTVARDEVVLRVNVGGMLMQQGRYEEALEEFLAVRRAAPDAKRVEINLANAYHGLERYADAIRSLDVAVRYLYAEAERTGRPSIEEILYCHELGGDILRKAGRPQQAIRQYEAALRVSPGNPRVQEKLEAVRAEAGS